jgi:hypothetical protein
MAKHDYITNHENPIRGLLLAAAVTAALAGPANAEVSDTGVFGYWTTFAGVATDGKPVCGMSTDWSVGGRGPTTGSFVIKYFGRPGLVVHIGRDGWQVRYGQPVPVQIQIDQAPAMKIVAYGADKDQGVLLEFVIKETDIWAVTGKPAIGEFLNLLSSGRQITVSFPDGNEAPWVGQLAGATAALHSFDACVVTMNAASKGAPGTAQAPGTTQPFTPKETPKPSTSSQPFRQL